MALSIAVRNFWNVSIFGLIRSLNFLPISNYNIQILQNYYTSEIFLKKCIFCVDLGGAAPYNTAPTTSGDPKLVFEYIFSKEADLLID